MADAISDYQAAVREYEKARKSAAAKIKMIQDVGRALRDQFPSFMGWQYGVDMLPRGKQYDEKARFEMRDWPDAEALKSVLLEWHNAFVKLHSAWNAIGDRAGLVPPPDRMEVPSWELR